MISRIQDVRVNIGTVAPRWFLIYLYARVFLLWPIRINQDFIPIKFGIGQRWHFCFHQVNAQVLYYIVLLSIVIFVEWRHWGDNEFTPNVDIVSHGSGLFDCASKSLNTKNGASKNEHSQSVDFFASIGQTFTSFPQAIWSSSCVLSGDLKPLQKPIRWTWLRWSCGLRPSCSKCWPMIRRFIPQKMWWSNESNSKDEQLFEYPWDSMRKLHMCVFFHSRITGHTEDYCDNRRLGWAFPFCSSIHLGGVVATSTKATPVAANAAQRQIWGMGLRENPQVFFPNIQISRRFSLQPLLGI